MKNKLDALVDELITAQNFSVGNDVVFLPDFQKSFNSLFQQKVYTDQETAYCQQFDPSLLRFASTWAAKEAVYKAIKQIDPASIAFKKIEIYRTKIGGKPTVKLPDAYDDFQISLSITHDGDYVWAIAMIKNLSHD